MKQGRIIEEHKTRYTISSNGEVYSAVVRGLFHRDMSFEGNMFPKVGDYVEYTEIGDGEAVIESLLPRRTEVVRAVLPRDRKDATPSSEVIVANVDIIFIVVGLDNDFNLNRVERYALLARQSSIDAVILLNKSDVVSDPVSYIEKIKERIPHVPVHTISAVTGVHMEKIRSYITTDTTAVLLGSSGAGKSTITNWLLDEQKQLIDSVRKNDSRGKHTTTSRQLFIIPTGGYLIDTPGMRELGVLSTEENQSETFATIDMLKTQCRFTSCDHEKTEGCAMLEAVSNGQIDTKHLENYIKIQREREYAKSKGSVSMSRKYKNRKERLDTFHRAVQKKKK